MKIRNFIYLGVCFILMACATTDLNEGVIIEKDEDSELLNIIEDCNYSIIDYFRKERAKIINPSVPLMPDMVGGENASLYNQAILTMVYILEGDNKNAEIIFDYYQRETSVDEKQRIGNAMIDGKFVGFYASTLISDNSGDFRTIGANAWFLMALEFYAVITNKPNAYSDMRFMLKDLMKNKLLLEVELGSGDFMVSRGYDAKGNLNIIDFITENNLSCYYAYPGFLKGFHDVIINALKARRLDSGKLLAYDKTILGKPHPSDLVSWLAPMSPQIAAMVFENVKLDDFSSTSLSTLTGKYITGIDFDDVGAELVSYEQHLSMISALQAANVDKDLIDAMLLEVLEEMDLLMKMDKGLPYVNQYTIGVSTMFEKEEIDWADADTATSVTSMVWLYFVINDFNPMIWSMEQKGTLTSDFDLLSN